LLLVDDDKIIDIDTDDQSAVHRPRARAQWSTW
jgi:hypothetical protein